MPDSTAFDRTRGTPPLDWGDAFDRLPLQAPAASAWPALATRVAMRTRRAHMRRRWALAASVAAVVLAPVLAWRAMQGPGQDVAAASHAKAASASASDARVAAAPVPMESLAPAPSTSVPATPGASVPSVEPAPAAPPRSVAAHRARDRIAGPRPAPDGAPSIAIARGTPPAAAEAEAGDADATRLAALQAESAHLEYLLRATGQDAAAAAPSLVLASALADEVQRIDGALADPALDTAARTALWNSRVQALREVAAVETAQRWRNAQGVSMDTALVRVD